jgi:hypothetical protein
LEDDTDRQADAQTDEGAGSETGAGDPRAALAESDLALVRALEDLIHVLIEKDVIAFTDLPEPVQQQLLHRQRLRARVRQEDDDADDGLVDL